jgi:hypothetical protein
VADDSIVPFTVDENISATAYLIGFTIAQQLPKTEVMIEAKGASLYNRNRT